jgi:hypothetical protein
MDSAAGIVIDGGVCTGYQHEIELRECERDAHPHHPT